MDGVCTCGHVEDEHQSNGTCTVDDCLCAGWEEDAPADPEAGDE